MSKAWRFWGRVFYVALWAGIGFGTASLVWSMVRYFTADTP